MTIKTRKVLLGCSAAIVAMSLASYAMAQQRTFNIPAQDATTAIGQFGLQSHLQVTAPADQLRGVRTRAVTGSLDSRQALRQLIAGTGLEIASDNGSTIVLRVAQRPVARPATQDAPVTPRRRADAPPSVPAADPQATALDEIVVTARRMQERIIDVPIAVSAFSAEQLDERKIEGGSELLRVIPNVNFSKDNFTGYNFSIRGVGTKATSVTADPAVAISFNNTALLRNRLFEQEYFDVQRLEVLRGPQGTLYGRNATAGVVNMLPNLPELGVFTGEIQGELGNYDTRRVRGHINIPLGETFALRVAGAATQRDGFDYNTVTENHVNGRDLWAGRVGALWEPNDRFRANFVWEHFEEDDDRSRTGKQLCTRGAPPARVEYTDLDGMDRSVAVATRWTKESMTPGCEAASLFTDDAYGIPNGRGFPFVTNLIRAISFRDRGGPDNDTYLFRASVDPFAPDGDPTQSRNLREISTFYDPKFQAQNDIFQLNLEWDLNDSLTLYSQTLYMKDSYYGSQDFFRSNSAPGLMADPTGRQVTEQWAPWLGVSAEGYGTFIDPQLGELDRLAAIDISESESRQWSQEFRLQSSFDGPFNFNLGANWMKFETEESYWIFSNAFTIGAVENNTSSNWWPDCSRPVSGNPNPNACMHIDPNPIGQLDEEGHNYYRNWNIAETESWAVFGEGYWNLTDALRLTAGLRYTDDTKRTIPISSQLLTADSIRGGGTVGRGYPRRPEEEQSWGEWTGRLALDWKPDLDFTDDTLVYTSYSRGYKAGGGNPAGPDLNEYNSHYTYLPTTYDPEYVDAFEIGVKNALDGGRLMINATAFYYDYRDYQISQLIDRAIHTENFDARTYGVEFEAAWAPTRNFRLDATLGYLNTRIGDGEESIDVMNRTQGRDDYYYLRPWPNSPTTCIVPAQVIGRYIASVDRGREPDDPSLGNGNIVIKGLCPGPQLQIGGFLPGGALGRSSGDRDERGRLIPGRELYYDPWSWVDPITGDSINGGRGFSADLSGNELPNAPELTFNIGAQYRLELPQGWDLTLRGDYYRQSSSYMRVYNSEYDRLKGWGNANLAVTLTNLTSDLAVQAYVKNVFDDTPITDGFTGPDELGNFTNVFTLDPRIIGVSVRKSF